MGFFKAYWGDIFWGISIKNLYSQQIVKPYTFCIKSDEKLLFHRLSKTMAYHPFSKSNKKLDQFLLIELREADILVVCGKSFKLYDMLSTMHAASPCTKYM